MIAVVALVLPVLAIYWVVSSVITRKAVAAWSETNGVEPIDVHRVVIFGRHGLVDYDVTWQDGDDERTVRLVAHAFGGNAWVDERVTPDADDATD